MIAHPLIGFEEVGQPWYANGADAGRKSKGILFKQSWEKGIGAEGRLFVGYYLVLFRFSHDRTLLVSLRFMQVCCR